MQHNNKKPQLTHEIGEFASDFLGDGFGDGGGDKSGEKDRQRHEGDVNFVQFKRFVDVQRKKHLRHVVDQTSQHVQSRHLNKHSGIAL